MLSQVTPAFDATASREANNEQIITQKWIALYPDGQEAWGKIRRTGYRLGAHRQLCKYKRVVNNDIIRRLRFPPSTEYSNNTANVVRPYVCSAVRILRVLTSGGTLNNHYPLILL